MLAVDEGTRHKEAVSLLRRLARQVGIDMEDARISVLAHEAIRPWPGPTEDVWFRWLPEACKSLGIRAKMFDLRDEEAWELVRDGACAATYLSPPASRFLTLVRVEGRTGYALPLEADGDLAALKLSSLPQMLGTGSEAESEPVRRWLIIDNPHITSAESHHVGKHLPPFSRLMGILRPEWNDVWVVFVFAFVVALLSMATPIAVEALVNTVAFGRFLQPVFVLSLILFVFLAFGAAIRGVQAYLVEIIQRRLFVRVGADLAYRLPRVQQAAYDAHDGPELVNRFFDVVTLQKVCAGLLLDAVTLVLATVVGMAVLAFYHPWLLAFDLILLALVVASLWLLGRGAVSSAIDESKYKYQVGAWFEEIARCRTAFKAQGGPELAVDRANYLVANYLKARSSHFRVYFRQLAFVLGIQALGATVLLGFGGWLVIRGQLTLGQLVAAELIVAVILSAVAGMGKHIESFYDLLAGVDKLGHLFDLPLERADGLLAIGHGEGAAVTLRDVSFKFSNRSAKLQSLSLWIAPGERIGLAGEPGSGKSMLLDLLYGLRRPEVGHLEIDHADPRDVRPDILRSQVAMVRGVEIFQGTVTDNILLGRHGLSISDAREVLKKVGLLEDILGLHDGLGTRLHSSGIPLTGTQTRLLMLARALVARPRLLLVDGLLDELPDETLQRVLPVIFPPERGATLVVVSGRSSVLEACDRVIHPTGVGIDVPVRRGPAAFIDEIGVNRKQEDADYDYY